MTWLIRNTIDRALFWSNAQGWVDIACKDLAAFDGHGKTSRLPSDGEWVDTDNLAMKPGIRPDLDLKIAGSAHSDDRWAEAHFDAAPWFHQASDREILELAQCEWGGDYPADYVAEYMADHDAEPRKMFDYIAIANADHNRVGFECWIDPGDARAWLNRHRPHLLPIITRMDEEAEHFEDAQKAIEAALKAVSLLFDDREHVDPMTDKIAALRKRIDFATADASHQSRQHPTSRSAGYLEGYADGLKDAWLMITGAEFA